LYEHMIIARRMGEGEWEILTIELDGMDVCACEDAYERVAHLDRYICIFRKENLREEQRINTS
jgi:hypothetical protein